MRFFEWPAPPTALTAGVNPPAERHRWSHPQEIRPTRCSGRLKANDEVANSSSDWRV